jgi:hypothetical protein
MNNIHDEAPMFGSIQEMIDAQTAENIRHAADAAREAALQLKAGGSALAPGVEAALAWKILQLLNARPPNADSIERDMRLTGGGEPVLH